MARNASQKWLHSGRGLPGSFMNENHHTMNSILDDNDDRLRQQDQQDTATRHLDKVNDRQVQQQNETDNIDITGQQSQRSVMDTNPYYDDEYLQQRMQISTSTNNYSRAKNQFPSAVQRSDNQDQSQLDPDLTTAADPEPMSRPPAMPSADSAQLDSAANSFDSNRAILNQPLVSENHHMNDQVSDDYYPDYDQRKDAQDGSGTEVFPPFRHTTDVIPNTDNPSYVSAASSSAMNTDGLNTRGPLDVSTNAPQHDSKKNAIKNSLSSSLGGGKFGRQKKRHLHPDDEYCAALPVLQSYVPYAQGVAAEINNEARYEEERQRTAASDRRYSLQQVKDAENEAPVNNRRRSSLPFHTLGKLFGSHRNRKSP